MSTCPNGHSNPEHYRYCGTCGSPLLSIPSEQAANPAAQAPSGTLRPQKAVSPRRIRRISGGGWFAIAVGVVAIVVVLVIVLTSTTHGTTGGSGDATSASSPSGGSEISGTQDEWLDAVCLPGKFHDGTIFPGATGGGFCSARNGSNLNVVVHITQWDSDFKMRNSLLAYRMTYYASCSSGNSLTTFSVNQRDPSPLSPLKKFGFTVHPVSSR